MGSAIASLVIGIIALYRRIRNADLVDNATRARLLEIVRSSPGIRLGELASQLGMTHKGADYQVHRMASVGQLVVRTHARQKRIYASGAQPRTDIGGAATNAMHHPVATEILRELSAHSGGVARAELRAKASVPLSTLNWHIRRLIEAQLITEEAGWIRSRATKPSVAGTTLEPLDSGQKANSGGP